MDTTPSATADRKRATDSGAASVEAVIATPVLMLLILAVIQAGLILHAQHMAQAAAHTAMDAARAELATGGDGIAAAEASLDRNAAGVLEDADVSVSRGTATVTVTVTGNATRIVPIFDAPIAVTVTGAVEHIAPLDGGD
jgi:Flp pilus assembly protein TadG